MLRGVFQDSRQAARLFAKQPLLTGATVLTLTFGIGLNAGVFTVINGLLFRPRVAAEPATFVEVEVQPSPVSLQDYDAYANAASLRALAAWTPVHAGSDLPLLVTCNFFEVYVPAHPLEGRVLRNDDCASPDATAVAVIGEDLWRNRYAADPGIVGRTLTLSGRSFNIVGVVPHNYDGQLRGPIWVPYTMASVFFDGRSIARERATPWLLGMTGRLRPGIARSAAAAELRIIARRQDQLVPGRETVLRVTDGSMIEAPLVREVAAWMVPLVMGALALVLLIASVNVAVLMLSRAVARRHEMAVRVSLGASRGRLARMLLTETGLLASMAAPPSAYFAYAVPRLFKAAMPTLPYYPFAVDRAVLLYLVAATSLAALMAGVAPAIESLKPDVAPALRPYARWFGVGRWEPRDILIGAQVAMSLVLLIGAALFLRAERRLVANPGYEIEHVLAAIPRISMPPHTRITVATFYERLEARVRAMPGVRSTAYANTVGGDAAAPTIVVTSERDGVQTPASVSDVAPTYFDTISLGFVRGATFPDPVDRMTVVVSESLARSLWPTTDPLGERLQLSTQTEPLTVIGVVRDVPSLLGIPAQRAAYRRRTPEAIGDALLVRFEGEGSRLATAVRGAVVDLDPNAVTEPRTLAAIRREVADRFLRLIEMIVFVAAAALCLASIGVYGAVAFAIARRMKEIGIRIALGANARHVTRIVLWTGWRPISAGLAAGTLATVTIAPPVAGMFRNTPAQIDPWDPVAYLGMAMVLAVAGSAAMIGPCRRANSTDATDALHHD